MAKAGKKDDRASSGKAAVLEVPAATGVAAARTPPAPRKPALPPELREEGLSARKAASRTALGAWTPPDDRFDPVDLLQGQEVDRMADLVPLRHERMAASAFAFYRGAALLMARDLGTRPSTGLTVQLAGDAHLANFGGFATAERSLIFDVNDFDETHPGPFEWDVQRLVASFEIAGRHKGFSAEKRSALVGMVASEYCDAMASFASMTRMDVWYARMDAEDVIKKWAAHVAPERVERFRKLLAKGRQKTSAKAVSRYTREGSDGNLQIISQPPFVEPLAELAGTTEQEIRGLSEHVLAQYSRTVPDDLKVLLNGYNPVDAARKVVGVGSVGTRCLIMLLVARTDPNDDLVLQLKQANASVLESQTRPSVYDNHGQRVVEGQRLMQASSDMLLGWTRITGFDGVERDYYVRQMWDWKTSADLETIDFVGLEVYARMCGWTLARAHAKSGSRHAISAYLGSGKVFVRAMQEFAESYADQNERDYAAFLAAIDAGRLTRTYLESPATATSTAEG